MRPLVVIGDYAWDVLVRTERALLKGGDTFGEVLLAPGGSAANVAVWARRTGQPVHFIGKVGRDRLGRLAREELQRERVRAHLIYSAAQLTGAVAVLVDHTGERAMVSGRGADFYLLPDELPTALLKRAGHLHLTAWSLFSDPPRAAALQAAAVAKAAGATLSLDPASFQMIAELGSAEFLRVTRGLALDIFFPNYQEAQALTGLSEPAAMAQALAAHYPGALIALKLDAQGALIYRPGQLVAIPPAPGELRDATGAGDAFAGAFLAHYLAQRDPVAAARYATRISAWVIARLGARPEPDAALDAIVQQMVD